MGGSNQINEMQKGLTIDRIVRGVVVLAVVAGLIWLGNYLRDALLPFFAACLIAYLLNPLVNYNRRIFHLKGRTLASLLVLLEMTVVIGAVIYFVVPIVISEVNEIEKMLASSSVHNPLPRIIPSHWLDEARGWIANMSLEEIIENDKLESIIDRGGAMVGVLIDYVIHTIEWLLTFVYVIFILIDYPQIKSGLKNLFPPRWRQTAVNVLHDVAWGMNRYFRAQLILCLCAAVGYSIGFSIVGIPLAILLGCLVGVLYIIPYVEYVTLFPVAAVCMVASMTGDTSFWVEFGKCLLVYIIVQPTCDYILTPKIMGKKLGMNAAIILLSLSVWGTLMGILGMILALPLTALMIQYYHRYINSHYAGEDTSEGDDGIKISDSATVAADSEKTFDTGDK